VSGTRSHELEPSAEPGALDAPVATPLPAILEEPASALGAVAAPASPSEAPVSAEADARRWQMPEVSIPWRTLAKAAAVIAAVGTVGFGSHAYYTRATLPGTVALTSTPSGADVLVGGEKRGTTPVALQLAPGEHAIELRRRGVSRRVTVTVSAGREIAERVDLSPAAAVGSLAVSSEPPGAKVILDGQRRGVTPLTIDDVPAGSHQVVLESSAGTIYRTVAVKTGAKAVLNEAIFSGWVAVFAPIELQIYSGKRLLGTTESGRIMVPPGRYELELFNSALKYRQTHVVEVESGKVAAVNIKSAEGSLSVAGPPGAEVWVDGERVGETPLSDVKISIGTRELTIRHPQLGERKLTVTISPGEVEEVNLEL
jgi:hypothetical protein